MPDQEPTFLRLDTRLDWKTDHVQDVAIGAHGLRLAASRLNGRASGPLSLDWLDGSLGGVILPKGMALDEDGRLYLVSPEEGTIKRYEPELRGFTSLPSIGPRRDPVTKQPVTDGRTLSHPVSLAISERRLYVVDDVEHRVQVFSIDPPYLLISLWGPRSAEGRPVAKEDPRAWQPVDVAAHGRIVYILDATGRIYRQRAGSDHLHGWVDDLGPGNWIRLAVDRDGVLNILNGEGPSVARYDRRGQRLQEDAITDAGTIRDNFDGPTIRLRYLTLADDPSSGRFCLPEALAWCGGSVGPSPAPEDPLGLCMPGVQPQDPGQFRLKPVDIKDFGRLAARLRRPRDPAARAVRKRLAETVRGSLAEWLPGIPVDADLEKALLEELNRLVLGPDLRDEKAFTGKDLPTFTQALVEVPQGSEASVARLNRLLLEAAFPLELHRSPLTMPGGLGFDRTGNEAEFAPDEPLGPYLYARQGKWVSKLLDSGIYRCQWHRIELDLAAPLPPGSTVTVSTYSSDEEDFPIPAPASVLWAAGGSFLGQLQQHQSRSQETTLDVLVQSREGRFLAVMVQLEGDGYSTPEIRAMRIHYPRVSYLSYLPAVYSADDESRWFMERFLSVFQTEWDMLEAHIEHFTALFDPAAVPDEFLDIIAGWLGLPLEEAWSVEKKRAMLKAVPRIYPRRGTQEGLRLHLQVYLENMNEVAVEKQPAFPLLLEGFRERQQVILSGKSGPLLDRQTLLWGPAQVGRLQLDVYATEGEVRLVSTGDPELDLFQEYAHRFRIFVPSAWVKTANEEAMLRRAIEAEKPAQTDYDLCLVEPRFQVGVQSMVGINTIIGQIPTMCLPCGDQLHNEPPSRAPHGRLGYDTVLGGTPPPAGSIYQISASFDSMVS